MAVSSSGGLPWPPPCPPCRRSFLRRLWRGGVRGSRALCVSLRFGRSSLSAASPPAALVLSAGSLLAQSPCPFRPLFGSAVPLPLCPLTVRRGSSPSPSVAARWRTLPPALSGTARRFSPRGSSRGARQPPYSKTGVEITPVTTAPTLIALARGSLCRLPAPLRGHLVARGLSPAAGIARTAQRVSVLIPLRVPFRSLSPCIFPPRTPYFFPWDITRY